METPLRRYPQLSAAYLAWSNRPWSIRLRRPGVALGLYGMLLAAGASVHPERTAALFAGSHRYLILAAAATATGGALGVARKRAILRSSQRGSWLASVPVRPASAWREARLIEVAPAGAWLIVIAAICGQLRVMAGAGQTHRVLLPFALALLIGLFAGVLAGYLIPPPRSPEFVPGSRYVPHAKAAVGKAWRASLAGLGAWPVRRAFASARPKLVARVALFLFLAVPLGATADYALAFIGAFVTLIVIVLLTCTATAVSYASRRWLRSLPLRSPRLLAALLLPVLMLIVGGGALESGFFILLGQPPPVCVFVGLCLATVGTASCLCASAAAAALAQVRPRKSR